MRVIFARHGETDWNARKLVQGQADIELNAAGRAQAAALGDALRGIGIVRVYASDLSRAHETGRIVAERLGGLPFAVDPRFRESTFGSLDGMPYHEIRKLDAEHPHNRPDWHDPLACDFRPWGGEHGVAMFERQRQALRDLHGRHPDETLLVIGHGRCLRVLLYGLGHDIVHFGNCQHHAIEFTA